MRRPARLLRLLAGSAFLLAGCGEDKGRCLEQRTDMVNIPTWINGFPYPAYYPVKTCTKWEFPNGR